MRNQVEQSLSTIRLLAAYARTTLMYMSAADQPVGGSDFGPGAQLLQSVLPDVVHCATAGQRRHIAPKPAATTCPAQLTGLAGVEQPLPGFLAT